MSSRAEALLQSLSQSIGVPDLKFDEQNSCTLLIDDRFRITILGNNENHLVIYGILGGYPEPAPEGFPMELLTANMLFAEIEGPHLGFEPLSKSLVLAKAIALDQLDPTKFEESLESMVQHQEHITQLLEGRGIQLQPVTE